MNDTTKAQSRYHQLIEKIFFDGYAKGTTEIPFARTALKDAAKELGIELPDNLGDVIYSIRFRTPMPAKVLATQPRGREWIIELVGRATLPTFITFTGVDEWTDLGRMHALSEAYPIEWGILFSPKRQGSDPRYPPMTFVRQLIKHGRWNRLAAHLCGGHTLCVMDGHALPADLDEMLLYQFGRAQINGAPVHAWQKVHEWSMCRSLTPIMQCADGWPSAGSVDWLFDKSGGRGRVPASWPAHPPAGRRIGFAGGLGPENVAQHVEAIAGSHELTYWIDMESGVRDDDNRFSLDKCEAVCRAVYGAR